MGPDSFVPLAERSGLIKNLTSWVLNEALRQISEWASQGIDIALSLNLSTQDLANQELPEANDQETLDVLWELYPQGTLELFDADVTGHDFWFFSVP